MFARRNPFALMSCIAIGMFLGETAEAASPIVAAPSFRVETDLYQGVETAPQSQHLTLFDSGVVYDLPLGVGSTITVFDLPRDRVVLLHKPSRVRTSISTEALVQMTAQVRAVASEQGAAKSLGLDAKVQSGPSEGEYVLEFGSSRYDVSGQTVNDARIPSAFAEFTAWAMRLNIARHVGAPPFARITLADYIANEGRLPRNVKLAIKRNFKTREFRSEHVVVERLSDLDRKKISDIGGMIASFQEVDLSEFPAN